MTMTWQLQPATLILLVASLLGLLLVLVVWPRRHTALGFTFILMSGAVALWSLSEFISLGARTENARMFWIGVNFIGIGIVSPAFLVFTLYYTGQGKSVTKPLIALLVALNVWQPFAIWTSNYHEFFLYNYSQYRLQQGPLFWVHTITNYLIILVSLIILAALFYRAPRYRQQVLTLVFGVSLPIIVNVLYVFELIPNVFGGIDLTPITFTGTILVLSSPLLTRHLLEVLPVAYREIFYHLTDPVILVDQENQIIDVNFAASEVLQTPPSAVFKQPAQDLLPFLAECLSETPISQKYHAEVAWTDNTIFDVRLTPLRDRRQTLRGRVIRLHDVTQQKDTENELRDQYKKVQQLAQNHKIALQAAALANRTKDQFLDNMSHELRTPLTAILGYTGLVVDEAIDMGLDPSMIRDLQKIQQSSYHLHDIITRILDWTKIETQNFDLHIESFPIQALSQELNAYFRPECENQGIQFTLHAPSDLPDVSADERRVQQILTNILNNAVKFTDKGTITLNITYIDTAVENWICCEVIDTGVGISDEALPIIFQAFAQGDNSHTKEYGGVGIGLTLSKHLCEIMGGRFQLESTPSKGTTIRVYLPVANKIPTFETATAESVLT